MAIGYALLNLTMHDIKYHSDILMQSLFRPVTIDFRSLNYEGTNCSTASIRIAHLLTVVDRDLYSMGTKTYFANVHFRRKLRATEFQYYK